MTPHQTCVDRGVIAVDDVMLAMSCFLSELAKVHHELAPHLAAVAALDPELREAKAQAYRQLVETRFAILFAEFDASIERLAVRPALGSAQRH